MKVRQGTAYQKLAQNSCGGRAGKMAQTPLPCPGEPQPQGMGPTLSEHRLDERCARSAALPGRLWSRNGAGR